MDEFGNHRTSRGYPRYRVLATAGAIAVSIVGTVSCAVAVAQPGAPGARRPASPAADGNRAALAAAPPAWRRYAPDRADRSARARLGGPAALPRLERRLAESARADAEQRAMGRAADRPTEQSVERHAGRELAAEARHQAAHRAARGARAKAEHKAKRKAERKAEQKAERKAQRKARNKAEREEKRKAKRKGKRRAVLATGRCKASFYASGQTTASGQPFKPDRLTAAHKSLPFGSRVRVIRPDTGESVTVRINDRGPFVGGRCLDLSRGAMRKMGGISAGVVPVRFEVLSHG